MRYLILIPALVALTACGGDSFDERGLDRIDSYVNALEPEISSLYFNVDTWVDSPTDERNLGDVRRGNDRLIDTHDEHWTDDFESMIVEDVPDWTVNRSRGDDEWTVDGEELADVLQRMDSAVENTYLDFDAVLNGVERDGEVDERDAEFAFESFFELMETRGELVSVLFNE